MKLRFIRLPKVLEKIDHSRAWVYQKIREGDFPRQHQIGLRTVAWLESEVDEWIKEKINQTNEAEGSGE